MGGVVSESGELEYMYFFFEWECFLIDKNG